MLYSLGSEVNIALKLYFLPNKEIGFHVKCHGAMPEFSKNMTMSYRKHGVRIESCFKETALKDVETPIKLSSYR